MLKKIAEKLEDIDAKYHDLYEQKKDGKFHLKVENDDGDAVLRAKQHEKERADAAEAKLKELEKEKAAADKKKADEAQAAEEEKLKKAGDYTALEESYKKKLEDQKNDYEARLQEKDGIIRNQTVDSVAESMATDLAEHNGHLMQAQIAARLTTEIADGKSITRVLDTEGKPSAMSVEELRKEFFTNEKYASIVVASKASGGGASNNEGTGGAQKKTKWAEYSGAELVALKRENPQAYDALKQTQEA
ncbi:MAG: hypothetical protein CMI54_06280 [Parcubacteria group bacterium]|jgi:hypothetical protein|nr:hypothetical protein [Parcubacteria group bacterium]|tara:strand:- start:12503 stop:13243 length:741 start_codon:yes stop_codon:yes gene_type:complete